MTKLRKIAARAFASLALLWATVPQPGLATTEQHSSEALARLWVERLAATMEEHASAADVDRLLELYADDAVYEHPQAGARIAGKTLLRKGISSHLGETRSPRLLIKQILFGDTFAVVELKVNVDIRQDSGWLATERRQVVVLELKNSRIQRIIDHWDH